MSVLGGGSPAGSHIFLCYASQDKQAAREVHERLTGAGFETWFDAERLQPGHDWEHEIRAAVRAAQFVVVILSTHSILKTGFVQRELRLALDAADERPDGTVYVIPIRLDDTPFPFRLSKLHWVDYREQGWFERLVRSLGSGTIGRTPPQGTASAPLSVDLLGLSINPHRVSPGDAAELIYRIRMSPGDTSIEVTLGASIVGRDGDEYFDASLDEPVSLAPGTAQYSRYLRIPASAPFGTYRLIGAVWYRRVGDRRLATLDRGFIVQVLREGAASV